MRKKALFILPLVIGAVLAPLSAAPFKQGAFRGEIVQRLIDLRSDLGLTETQRREIRSVVEGYRREIKDQWATGKAAREGMRSAVQQHGAGSPEATAAAERIGDAATSGSLLFARILSDVKPLLTDDQLQKIESGRSDITGLLESRLNAGGL